MTSWWASSRRGQIFAAAKHLKSLVSLVDANHLLTRRADAEYAAQVLAAWASRYLPETGAQDADGPTLKNGLVEVYQHGGAHYATRI